MLALSKTSVVRAQVVPVAVAIGLTVGAAALAAPTAPSPFAGDYCYADVAAQITVADTGHFTGYSGLSSLSGRIAEDGTLSLTMTTSSFSFGGEATHGSKSKPSTHKAVGVATLDATGNMYWVLHWDFGIDSEFFWVRCD